MDTSQAVKYIKDSLAGNFSGEAIRQSLISAGWDPAMVDAAFSQVSVGTPVSPPVISPPPRIVSAPVVSSPAVIDPRPTHHKSRLPVIIGIVLLLAAVGAGIFLVLNRPAPPEPVPAAPAPVISILTAADIKTSLTQALSADMAYEAETVVFLQSCPQTVLYTGAAVAGNSYAKQQNISLLPAAGPECVDLGATDLYLENYRIGADLYGRQQADKNYEKITDPARLTAPAPGEFLTVLLGDFAPAEFSPASAAGSIFTSQYQITDSTRSGQIAVSVNAESRKLTRIDYTFAFSGQPATGSGKITFSDPPAAIQLPNLAPPANDFLVKTLTDITGYAGAEFMVNTATYGIDSQVGAMPLIHIISGEKTTAKTADCFLSKKDCMEKLLALRGFAATVIDIVKTAPPVACEAETPQTGFASQIYRDKTRIRVTNKGRNPRESFDFSFTVDLMLTGEKQNTYTVRVRSGQEYCYAGSYDPQAVNRLVLDLTSFSQSLL